MVVLLFLIQQ